MPNQTISLVECPRDAMQGWAHVIPTDTKIQYLNALLQVGFHTLDFGSFVSAKAIPQMADTAAVIKKLERGASKTRLLAIVANTRGAEEALIHEAIDYLGFPFSISETFQQRNANSSIDESLQRVEDIQELCMKNNRQLVVYLSMGFGNPYGDPFSASIAIAWAKKIAGMGIKTLSLADTVGLATPQLVKEITTEVVAALPATTIGVHLHSSPENWTTKLNAALEAGCRRIDGALNGIGGCPMAGDQLVGNMDTALMIPYLQQQSFVTGIDIDRLQRALKLAQNVFVS